MERRLAAILSADVVGYSRLMESDEEATLAGLKARRQFIDDQIVGHRGRVFGSAGDSVIAEFASPVEAVRCAIEIQQELKTRNSELSKDRQMRFRVGINLGDVIVDNDNLYGDGVNLAARLQEIAVIGGVCLSDAAFQQVRGKVQASFADGGAVSVKNISAPVRVWNWSPCDEVATRVIDVTEPVPGFDGRPAIAVLAFDNLSRDPDQEFLADGIAEDILTRLAMWRWLPVIARNSSFTYKGRAVDVKKVGAELGARYVLEGSVRKAGDRVRIAGQLIDTETGHHVWADRYDRGLDDIFAVQDEITDAIVAALEPAVGRAEMQRAQRKNPENLDAWGYYQRGMWFLSKITKQDTTRAHEMLVRAVDADPNFAPAHAGISLLGWLEISIGFSADPDASLAAARDAALRAVRLDELDPFAQAARGYTSVLIGEYDTGIASARRSVELNPSFALGYHCLHTAMFMAGRFRESLDAAERACRVSPSDPWLFYSLCGIGACHYMLREYQAAVEKVKLSVERYSEYASAYRWLAVSLAQLGRTEEAQEALSKFLQLSPGALKTARHVYPFRNQADLTHYIEGLNKAGLPE